MQSLKKRATALYKSCRELFQPGLASRKTLAANKRVERSDARLAFKPVAKMIILFFIVMGLTSSVWLITGWMRPAANSMIQAGPTPTPRPKLEIFNPPLGPTPAPAAPKDRTAGAPTETKEEKPETGTAPFYTVLEAALKKRGQKLEDVCSRDDPVERRILEDYGAIFVAIDAVAKPPVCIFQSEAEVAKFQSEAKFTPLVIGGAKIELQPAAMQALIAAREEAQKQGVNITPRGGSEAARRSYEDTVRLWNSRFLPALSYWTGRGRISKEQAARLRNLSLREQVREVLELEKKGIYFSKDFSKSILYSIAAPGSSQHIMMLALDVAQFGDPRVRRIMADYGWFQTVKSDLPHFTFIGVPESSLPSLGLRRVMVGSQVFWIPNVGESDK